MTTQIIHAYLAPDQVPCPLHVLLLALEWAMKDEQEESAASETAGCDSVEVQELEPAEVTL